MDNFINHNIVPLDFGNSRLKILISGKIYSFQYSKLPENEFLEIIKKFNKNKIIVYSNVNPKESESIISLLEKNNIKTINANDFLIKYNIIDFSEIKGMGQDRKLGLIGALHYSEPPLITIDCGTAITINILDKQKKCLGGAIFPSFRLQSLSLHNNTSLLPEIEFRKTDNVSGKNTEEAILSGIYFGIIGAVKEIIERIKLENGFSDNLSIILTGGNSKFILENLKNSSINIIFAEDLVLDGILKLSELYIS